MCSLPLRLLGASLVLATALGAQTSVSDTLCQREADANRAIMNRDRSFLTQLYADEFQHVNYIGGLADKKDEIDFFTSPNVSIGDARIDSCTARRYGDVAVATGLTIWTHAVTKSSDLSGSYRFTRVYVYRDNRWQVVASQYSKLPAATN
jgi:ketosteroid isomerase-like protein